jgi:polyisoprenoid-binding protein YceI
MATEQITNGGSAWLEAAERWLLVPKESSAEFHVKHFWNLVTVSGRFERFEGTLARGPEHGARIDLSIDAESLDTGNKKRDEHLRSADFFHASEHPTVTFISTAAGPLAAGKTTIEGELTAAGQTIPVTVFAEVKSDGRRLEIDGWTTVDRTRFDMTWNPLRMVSTEAELHVKVVLVPSATASST